MLANNTVGSGVITLTETHIHSSNLAYFATDAGWSSRSEKVELAALIFKAILEEMPPLDGYLLDELHTDSVLGLAEMEEAFGAIPESLAPAIADVARVFENILLAGLNGNPGQVEIIAEIAGLYARHLFTFFAGTVYNQFWITRTGTYSAGGKILILTVEDEPVTFTRRR